MKPARSIGAQLMCIGLLFACSPTETDLQPMQRDWGVMGTELSITVYHRASNTAQASDDLDAAFSAVAEIDDLMSLYKPDSELNALNESAGTGARSVSAHTFAVLEAAQHYATLSQGAMDITVEPLVRLWGFFDVQNATVPEQALIDEALRKTGIQRLTLNHEAKTVALEAETHVDVGSIAKGFGVDRALDVLREREVPAALVNLGGTVGVLGTHPAGRPWAVGIRHPRDNRLMGEIRLEKGAVSTSGDYDRYFEHDGKRYSHILDPRTGWPVGGVSTVTVVAPDATGADALSTAAFVLGPEKGMTLLAGCRGVEGLMVKPDSESDQLTVQLTAADSAAVSIQVDTDPMVATHVHPTGSTGDLTSDCVWKRDRE